MTRTSKANKSSKYTGVSYHKYTMRYEAYIHVGFRKIHLGRFDDEEEAARAVDEKRRELGLASYNELSN